MGFLYDNEALEDTLDALDQEFYRYEDNLGERSNNYVRAHPEIRVGALETRWPRGTPRRTAA